MINSSGFRTDPSELADPSVIKEYVAGRPQTKKFLSTPFQMQYLELLEYMDGTQYTGLSRSYLCTYAAEVSELIDLNSSSEEDAKD